MKPKKILAAGLLAAVGGLLAGLFLQTHPAAQKSVAQNLAPAPAQIPVDPAPESPAPEKPVALATPAAPPAKIESQAAPKKNRSAGNSAKSKAPIQDPDARAALSFVGADPAAEEYWVEAIHDASLPAEERKDLIEDLNEDGLSDPHHPGPDDLPLIVNRLLLVEDLAPAETDPVNIAALQEAHKDLLDLLDGRPVQ